MTALDPVLPREVVCGDTMFAASGAADRAVLEDVVLEKLASRGAVVLGAAGRARLQLALPGSALRLEGGV